MKNRYTEETIGTVTKISFNNNGSRRLTVEYIVYGSEYKITENITVHSKAIKIGFIPIGQKKVECITAGMNDKVTVVYNPENPEDAHIKGNDGRYV